VESAFGSGVQRPFPTFPMLSAASFGHEAAGGSAAVADPDLGLAIGFTTDRYPASSGVSPMLSAVLPTILHCSAHSDRPRRTAS
jgi:CubicO group peptidase (beta-lactamase class C family)